MSSTQNSQGPPSQQATDNGLASTSRERLSSWVISLNLTAGFCVTVLTLIWLIADSAPSHRQLPVRLVSSNTSATLDAQTPLPEEPPAEETARLRPLSLERTFAAVRNAVDNSARSLTSMYRTTTTSGPGGSIGYPDLDDEYEEVIPRWNRWRVSLKAGNETSFAAQLDAAGIHLALFGGGDATVYYARDFTGRQVTYQREGGRGEKRMYFAPADARAKQWTDSLLRKVGYDTRGKYAVHFYPTSAEHQLALAEARFAKFRTLASIRRTYFSLRFRNGRPTFVVTRQEYHPVEPVSWRPGHDSWGLAVADR